jgi:activator of HSP90 ATPase
MESLSMNVVLPVSPKDLCKAWLNSAEHSGFTGAKAEINPHIGGVFTAWDGYISGKTLAIETPRRILQSWRTTEFPEGSPDSLLEILFEPEGQGTRMTLNHSKIPDGQKESYAQGWQDYYFTPMLEYFQLRNK